MKSVLVVAILCVAGTIGVSRAPASAQAKWSGTVVSVEPDGRTFTVEELGLAGAPVRHSVVLGPGASIVRVERRTEAASPPGAWPGGFRESPADVGALRAGDFVTVTGDETAGRSVARVVEIVGDAALQPAPGPAASPR